MKRSLKTLLLWLLISLFPLQGMALVMSPSCGKVSAVLIEQHGAPEHRAASAHCSTHDAGDSADPAAAQHASCSACAACCIGASAPPSNQAPAAIHKMSESRFALLGVPGGDFIPAGLERPPKFS